VSPGRPRFFHELCYTARRLAAYFAALAALGYGAFSLINGELINVLAAADQQLEWMKPKAAPSSRERFHASLKPKLRGTFD
jgi:hypothetical protein